MARFAALLRGMNVGGHRITNDELRSQFEGIGFSEVVTVLASGNVVFTTEAAADRALEQRIEAHLRDVLGYAVPTFVRSAREMESISTRQPFPGDAPGSGETIHVMFLRNPLAAAARRAVATLSTAHDSFDVDGREVYWLCRGRMMEATYDQKAMTAILGKEVTVRTQATVGKLLVKF